MVVLGGGAVSYERGTPVGRWDLGHHPVVGRRRVARPPSTKRPLPLPFVHAAEREFFIDNLLVRIHLIIVMIRWTGLAPWEFEFPFPGSLLSTFLGAPNILV